MTGTDGLIEEKSFSDRVKQHSNELLDLQFQMILFFIPIQCNTALEFRRITITNSLIDFKAQCFIIGVNREISILNHVQPERLVTDEAIANAALMACFGEPASSPSCIARF
ncbi:MAG: hypothetical protein NTX25_17940 [Proteobacteria bacterium]|nr:hypothetical protein [Pseudomonadota bacterium]